MLKLRIASAYLRTDGNRVVYEYDFDVVLAGCKYHSLALHAPEHCGLEVFDEYDFLSDKIVRLIELCDTGSYGARFASDVDRQLKKLVGLGDGFAGDDLADNK